MGRAQECLAAEEAAHYERVDVNSLITNDAKTVGSEHVAISQMNEYGFDKILHGLDFTREQITYSKMLIVGRMVHPGSERETVRWVSETSGVGKLLGAEVKRYDTALHRTAVLLWENHAAIEQELSKRAREIFSLKETKRQKKYDTTIERIGRLKERYKVGNFHTVAAEQADGKASDIQFEKNDQAQAKEDAIGT